MSAFSLRFVSIISISLGAVFALGESQAAEKVCLVDYSLAEKFAITDNIAKLSQDPLFEDAINFQSEAQDAENTFSIDTRMNSILNWIGLTWVSSSDPGTIKTFSRSAFSRAGNPLPEVSTSMQSRKIYN